MGALTNRPAISISGPGLFLTKNKVGIDLSTLEDFSVNIVPRSDAITEIDQLEGMCTVHTHTSHVSIVF